MNVEGNIYVIRINQKNISSMHGAVCFRVIFALVIEATLWMHVHAVVCDPGKGFRYGDIKTVGTCNQYIDNEDDCKNAQRLNKLFDTNEI